MSSRKCRFPPGVAGEMGPQRSPWTKSNRPCARYCIFCGKEVHRCFVATQQSQICSMWLMCGSPHTISSRSSFLSASKWRCPYLSCQHHAVSPRSEEHTSELQSHHDLVCRLLLEKK